MPKYTYIVSHTLTHKHTQRHTFDRFWNKKKSLQNMGSLHFQINRNAKKQKLEVSYFKSLINKQFGISFAEAFKMSPRAFLHLH